MQESELYHYHLLFNLFFSFCSLISFHLLSLTTFLSHSLSCSLPYITGSYTSSCCCSPTSFSLFLQYQQAGQAAVAAAAGSDPSALQSNNLCRFIFSKKKKKTRKNEEEKKHENQIRTKPQKSHQNSAKPLDAH